MSIGNKLKLVHSFRKEEYIALHLKVENDPSSSQSDRIYIDAPDYQDHKFLTKPMEWEQTIHAAMRAEGIMDYFVFRGTGKIDAYFRTELAVKIATAHATPESFFEDDLYFCRLNASRASMEKIAKNLEGIFNRTLESTKISCLCDEERKVIFAQAKNGPDFIRFLKARTEIANTYNIEFAV